MIYGIGVDTTTISRIEKSIKNELFIPKFFGQKEIEFFNTKKNNTQSIAANFSAKEAFGKALKTGLAGFVWKDVMILRDEKKAPYFHFEGDILKFVKDNNLLVHVSLTHENDFATAFVVIEK